MGNRVRYKKHTKKNEMISQQIFVSQSRGSSYRVVLNLEERVYKIRNERTKEFVVKSKAYGSISVLKRNARKHLEKLGVVLKKESRDRTFGLCEKNYTQKKHEEEGN